MDDSRARHRVGTRLGEGTGVPNEPHRHGLAIYDRRLQYKLLRTRIQNVRSGSMHARSGDADTVADTSALTKGVTLGFSGEVVCVARVR